MTLVERIEIVTGTKETEANGVTEKGGGVDEIEIEK